MLDIKPNAQKSTWRVDGAQRREKRNTANNKQTARACKTCTCEQYYSRIFNLFDATTPNAQRQQVIPPEKTVFFWSEKNIVRPLSKGSLASKSRRATPTPSWCGAPPTAQFWDTCQTWHRRPSRQSTSCSPTTVRDVYVCEFFFFVPNHANSQQSRLARAHM